MTYLCVIYLDTWESKIRTS